MPNRTGLKGLAGPSGRGGVLQVQGRRRRARATVREGYQRPLARVCPVPWAAATGGGALVLGGRGKGGAAIRAVATPLDRKVPRALVALGAPR
jgi:hypothetical protein